MKPQKGFSMVGLMAVVAIIAVMAVISLPVYNQYIERTKVSKEIPVIGTYKNDIAACFMKNDSLENCNDGESGIHPGLDNNGKIMSLDVFKGNIVMIIDAKNHVSNIEPVELMYMVNQNLEATSSTLDWSLYCNDYNKNNNALVKECKGLITDKDGDGYDDSLEEEWNSDPLDPDSVPVNWEETSPLYTDWVNDGGRVYTSNWSPEMDAQVSSFEQTRNYDQDQTRVRTNREKEYFSGNIRELNDVIEERTIQDQESRMVAVMSSPSNGEPGFSEWQTINTSCGSWSPSTGSVAQGKNFTQSRSCDLSQEREKYFISDNTVLDSQKENRTINENETRNAVGTKQISCLSKRINYSSWSSQKYEFLNMYQRASNQFGYNSYLYINGRAKNWCGDSGCRLRDYPARGMGIRGSRIRRDGSDWMWPRTNEWYNNALIEVCNNRK